jgi:oligoribonuclease NrnB/cAMP/cGMP phosphodiesterase (DHH superfamily)
VPVVVSHTKDLDGLAAAAIAQREYPGSRVLLIDYSPEYVDWLEDKLGETSDEKVIVADIGCNKASIGRWAELLKSLKSRRCEILWFDHHVWDNDCLTQVRPYVAEIVHSVTGRCAAEIVWEKIGNRSDLVEKRLSVLAHDSDFNLWKEPMSVALSQLISYYNHIGGDEGLERKKRLVDLLSVGIFWTYYMDEELAVYRVLLEEEKKKLISSARVKTINGYRVVVAFRGAYSGTEAANLLFSEVGGDIAILVSSNGTLSIRSWRDDVNTKAIGEAFNGGGHLTKAAGGTVRDVFPNPEHDQIDKVASYIFEKLKKTSFVIRGGSPPDDR